MEHVMGEFFVAGYAMGYAIAWLLYRKPAAPPNITANLVIDPAVLHQVNAQVTLAWLDKHGLTWMPKGATYDPAKTVKKNVNK